MEFAAMLADE